MVLTLVLGVSACTSSPPEPSPRPPGSDSLEAPSVSPGASSVGPNSRRHEPLTCDVTIPVGGNIQAALAARDGGTVCLAPGVHRLETPVTPRSGQTLGGLGGAILSGGRELAGWASGPRAGTWQASTSQTAPAKPVGSCEDDKKNLCRIPNQVFVDGIRQELVSSPDEVHQGFAFIDYQRGRVILGRDPSRLTVTVSITPSAVEATEPQVTIRDLTVEFFATKAQFGAISVGPKSRVVGVEVRHNHGVGVKLAFADGSVVEDSNIHHNGQLGISQYASKNVRIERNRVAGNNTDGFWVSDWEAGGIKMTQSSGVVARNLIENNVGIGVWCDIDVHDVVIQGNDIIDNYSDGVRFEISRKGQIVDNFVRGNGHRMGRGMGKSIWDGGGVTINTAVDVDIRHNTLQDNLNAVSLQARERGKGPEGEWRSGRILVADNAITLHAGEGIGFVAESTQSRAAELITFENNHYHASSGAHWVWDREELSADQWRDRHESNMTMSVGG